MWVSGVYWTGVHVRTLPSDTQYPYMAVVPVHGRTCPITSQPWLSLTVFDSVWLSLTVFDSVWLSLVPI